MFKKSFTLILVLLLLSLNIAQAEEITECRKIEHLDVNDKAPNNIVIVTNNGKTVEKGNVLQLQFDERFYSKCEKAGTIVNFVVPQALYTRERTLLLPCGTKIVGVVTNVENPKWFNKNARVSINFKRVVFPDNTCIEINALPFTCDNKLKEGPWITAGKVLLSTITLGAVGTGAGVGFAFIPTPARIGTGLAIGIPVGCSVGFVLGLVTPGCHYKAKCGENIYAILVDDFSICNRE